jgi:hypothetical protein
MGLIHDYNSQTYVIYYHIDQYIIKNIDLLQMYDYAEIHI